MIYWIRLIADQTYRRPGSSKVYDYLYSYIHEYGFYGVIKLFEKFGFRILPTPYRDDDFADLSKGLKDFDVRTALSLAKASQLIYQDLSYVKEISRRWGINVEKNFEYIDSHAQDTQAFLFKTDEYIVVAFRGSQEIKDWQTNFSTRLKKFALTTQMEPLDEDITPPRGQVHRGFQTAWDSVERRILRQIQHWNEGRAVPLPLLITGHSLGGALATVAAASLVKRKFPVQGLYTFGQPRVGDLIFVTEISLALKGRVFRFVNNNDIVPHIPPPYLPWNPFRLYVHIGQTRYFNARGSLMRYPNPVLRLLDFFIGLIRDSFEPGFDLIKDHYMEYYISNLEKALEVEQEKERLMKEELADQ
nr:lipase family protein [Leptolyngbya sp. FACHB-16]